MIVKCNNTLCVHFDHPAPYSMYGECTCPNGPVITPSAECFTYFYSVATGDSRDIREVPKEEIGVINVYWRGPEEQTEDVPVPRTIEGTGKVQL